MHAYNGVGRNRGPLKIPMISSPAEVQSRVRALGRTRNGTFRLHRLRTYAQSPY